MGFVPRCAGTYLSGLVAASPQLFDFMQVTQVISYMIYLEVEVT